jgi:hypothetical protein
MVDGVRDELVEGKQEDDDSWVLRRIVVECKHRMRVLLAYPRLSECIQAVVYCQMYNAEAADIIQVLRTVRKQTKKIKHAASASTSTTISAAASATATATTVDNVQIQQQHDETKSMSSPRKAGGGNKQQYLSKSPSKTSSKSPSKGFPVNNRLITHFFEVTTPQKVDSSRKDDPPNEDDFDSDNNRDEIIEQKAPNESSEEEKKEDNQAKTSGADQTPPAMDMEIEVNRVSLNDHYSHLSNWNGVILPRLRQWTEAVYQIRQSDDLRYRLLSLMAQVQSVEDPARRREHTIALWDLTFEHCPYLRESKANDCFRRELSSFGL